MTKDEIDQLRRDWERRHPGESFDAMLRDELAGATSPTSWTWSRTAPRNPPARASTRSGGAWSASSAISPEPWAGSRPAGKKTSSGATWPGSRSSRRTCIATISPDEERRELRDDLDFRIELVQQSVEDHRRAIDSVANLAAQVASMVVAITVGAILTAVSGGALGPVMIAVIASVAATLTTMGTKALIQGGSYGDEDMGIDLAIGVVDALTAAATAGMGGRILRGATGVAQQAARPTQVRGCWAISAGPAIAQRVARSRAGQVVGRAAARANQAQSGFLARGIKGRTSWRAWRASTTARCAFLPRVSPKASRTRPARCRRRSPARRSTIRRGRAIR